MKSFVISIIAIIKRPVSARNEMPIKMSPRQIQRLFALSEPPAAISATPVPGNALCKSS